MPRHSIVLRLSFVLLALAGGVPAHGADTLVELQAPDTLRPLLVRHLDFLERPPEDVLDAAGRVALMRRARKEIREILATEGYFSPAIERQDRSS